MHCDSNDLLPTKRYRPQATTSHDVDIDLALGIEDLDDAEAEEEEEGPTDELPTKYILHPDAHAQTIVLNKRWFSSLSDSEPDLALSRSSMASSSSPTNKRRGGAGGAVTCPSFKAASQAARAATRAAGGGGSSGGGAGSTKVDFDAASVEIVGSQLSSPEASKSSNNNKSGRPTSRPTSASSLKVRSPPQGMYVYTATPRTPPMRSTRLGAKLRAKRASAAAVVSAAAAGNKIAPGAVDGDNTNPAGNYEESDFKNSDNDFLNGSATKEDFAKYHSTRLVQKQPDAATVLTSGLKAAEAAAAAAAAPAVGLPDYSTTTACGLDGLDGTRVSISVVGATEAEQTKAELAVIHATIFGIEAGDACLRTIPTTTTAVGVQAAATPQAGGRGRGGGAGTAGSSGTSNSSVGLTGVLNLKGYSVASESFVDDECWRPGVSSGSESLAQSGEPGIGDDGAANGVRVAGGDGGDDADDAASPVVNGSDGSNNGGSSHALGCATVATAADNDASPGLKIRSLPSEGFQMAADDFVPGSDWWKPNSFVDDSIEFNVEVPTTGTAINRKPLLPGTALSLSGESVPVESMRIAMAAEAAGSSPLDGVLQMKRLAVHMAEAEVGADGADADARMDTGLQRSSGAELGGRLTPDIKINESTMSNAGVTAGGVGGVGGVGSGSPSNSNSGRPKIEPLWPAADDLQQRASFETPLSPASGGGGVVTSPLSLSMSFGADDLEQRKSPPPSLLPAVPSLDAGTNHGGFGASSASEDGMANIMSPADNHLGGSSLDWSGGAGADVGGDFSGPAYGNPNPLPPSSTQLDVVYDPVLNAYQDQVSGKWYQLNNQ